MLTPEQKAAIRAEEVFRAEIRNEIASAGRHQQCRRKAWDVLNSSLVIWFLTSVVVAAISYMISDGALNRERRETLRRLKWEVYNDGLDFENSIKQARNRRDYEAFFSQNLQNPKARVVDLKLFSFDRITFDMENLGATADQNAATAARQATLHVWNLIEEKLKKYKDWDKPIDEPIKKDLDESICPIVRKEIVAPFNIQAYKGDGQAVFWRIY
jgi:hypothetical protein